MCIKAVLSNANKNKATCLSSSSTKLKVIDPFLGENFDKDVWLHISAQTLQNFDSQLF
jgi:hypothetical protein